MPKERPRAGPFQALRHRDFAKVWSAGLISQTGDYLLLIGLPFFVFRLTGSVLATGTMFLVALLPPIFLGSVAGVFVDRWSRKWTMVTTNLVLGVGLLPLLLVTTPDRLWIVYLVALFEACVDPFLSPAEGALIPQLVPAHDLVSANALYGSSRQIARLVGAAAGGLVVGIWGLSGVAGLDAITFWAAAGLVSQIDELRPPLLRASGAMREGFRRLASKFRDEWVEGLRIATRSVPARALLVFTLLISVGEGVVTTLFAPFIVGVLRGSGPDFGAFVGLQAVGGIVGALAASSLG
ncbi:MAG TPA: MFS transporter, partial [Thermoplasmata archaeon]|nr:MFS transporter [Thermoplasmata archaeon]